MINSGEFYSYAIGYFLGGAMGFVVGVGVAYPTKTDPPEVVTCQDVTLTGDIEDVTVEPPESPVEATETEEVLEVIQEQDKPLRPSSPRKRRKRPPTRPRLDIDMDSTDPLRGLEQYDR